jgi:YD repeat-containing protein
VQPSRAGVQLTNEGRAPADHNYSLGANSVRLFGRNGLVTSTFAYDADGNLAQKTVDGTTTTYIWDYANRLTALGVAGQGTTTYGYDWAGNRVLQTGTSTAWIYPSKWYSVASSTGSGAQYATTTNYVFNGDTLVATVDQQTARGNATGTPPDPKIRNAGSGAGRHLPGGLEMVRQPRWVGTPGAKCPHPRKSRD